MQPGRILISGPSESHLPPHTSLPPSSHTPPPQMQRLILELESDVVTLRRRLRQSEEEMAKKIKVQGICDGDL